MRSSAPSRGRADGFPLHAHERYWTHQSARRQQRIIDGLWTGKRKCIDPKAGVADLWNKNREQSHYFVSRDIVVEVRHVKAHRTQDMSHFERFVTKGNEKADELAKGAVLDEGFVAEVRANTMQQERAEVNAALQYAASFFCLVQEWEDCGELKPKPKEKWTFVDQKREENETSNRNGVPDQQVSRYEVWKE